jgi:COP9 signalosome complex subunit 7
LHCGKQVHFAAGRDLRPEQLDNMIQTLATWLGNSDSLLLTIQEKIKWADSMSELDRRHKKEVEDKAEEIRKTIKVNDSLYFIKITGQIHSSFLSQKPRS